MEDTLKQIKYMVNEMDRHVQTFDYHLKRLISVINYDYDNQTIAELVLDECSQMTSKLGEFSVARDMVRNLFNYLDKQKPVLKADISSKVSETSTEDIAQSEDEISLRPQTKKVEMTRPIQKSIHIEGAPFVEAQNQIMRELFSLQNTEYRYVDGSGLYPRINFLQGTPAMEVKHWFDFGVINAIYMTPPDFPEIKLLPNWIYDGTRDVYLNNPTIAPKDILVLKFLSAGPDFYNEERYNSYHFIQIGKSETFSITANLKDKKEFTRYFASDIHYRRAIGIRIVMQGMENSFKKPFRCYGGRSILSSVMLAPAKVTPPSAEKIVQKKIQLLEEGKIKSSPQAQVKICKMRKHIRDTCPACSSQKKKQEDSSFSNEDD